MVAALAKRSGVRVIGVSRDAARAHEMPLACDVIVDATTDLQERLSEACGGLGAHAVIDNVCVSPTWDACISVLRAGGRVVISGSLGSATVCFAPGPFYVAGQSIIGVRTASRSNIREFWSEIKAGLRPELGRVEVFPLTSAPEVHHLVETGQKMGHYVLSPNGLGSSQ
jgi:D-arabinose 1-dehydrogenase-like Zn-dependent alcohol dehydrogenase